MEKRLDHEKYMKLALEYAQKAFMQDEVPIGALVINEQGEVIGTGYNQVENKKTQVAHAEMQALQEASAKVGNWRLENCWLYVTLEPCSMCNGAIRLSRLSGVIFGAQSNLFGCHLDRDSFAVPTNDEVFLKGGICQVECAEILKKFFKKRRGKDGKN